MTLTVAARCLRLSALIWIVIAQSAQAQLSFQRPPIEYSETVAADPVATLIKQIDGQQRALGREHSFGYLNSVLKALDIPASSQTLVFSKTSLQRHLISPSNPRAIYFNDDSYVAWVPEGKMIEIASVDPALGTIFYTIDQTDSNPSGQIVRRGGRCLFCHASSDTGRIPGLLMQSVYTDSGGNRVFSANAIPTNSSGPLQGRWAGWFVTGKHGGQRHLGNLTINEGQSVSVDDTEENANVIDLSDWFDVDRYLTPHSDIVALLVLRHQISMHNRLIDAHHQARLRLYADAVAANRGDDAKAQPQETSALLDQLAEQVVDALLMVGRTEFSDPINGTSTFAEDFSNRGRKDSQGRGLRDLDLRKSLFRYSCSYLIYTPSFDSLPDPLLSRIYRRLFDVLNSTDNRDKYSHLPDPDRSAILQILRETKNDLPAEWEAAGTE